MSKSILIIEDDKDISKVLKDQLRMDAFYVFCAENAEEGMNFFKEKKPDLIILDLNLPDIDGIKFAQNIRKISQIPIIMLTARDSLSDKIRGLECGADDYITKPFEYLELIARIKACFRRFDAISQKSQKLKYGNLVIDLLKKELKVDDNIIKLTKKEYELLELLVTHEGEVLKRDFILSQIWPNEELYAWSRALDVHIRRLRQKIEPEPENPIYIITYPGLGYKFNNG